MIKKGRNKSNKILKLLYRSFDIDLKEKEQKQLKEALQNSEELRKEKDQILAQRQALSDSAAKFFNPFFAERVMNRISSIRVKRDLDTIYESLKVVFRRFAVIGTIIMIVLISYNFITGDSLSTDEVFYASDTTFEEILDSPLF